jgi:hypothetical protein
VLDPDGAERHSQPTPQRKTVPRAGTRAPNAIRCAPPTGM